MPKMGDFSISKYHSFLCPDRPDFLDEYLTLPSLQRLGGIGLLCGTDWTPLFHNKFFYSRLDHSVGTALITWNFTHDKRQTLASLFHDIATPAFSHAVDFRNGDRLKQESTEALTHDMINGDLDLSEMLFRDGIYKYEIDDYHRYPVADNDIPGLSADRLEYMYPSGAALCGEWTLDEIEKSYSAVTLLKNEKEQDELGFAGEEAALDYVRRFLDVSLILQKGEDKIAMQLAGDIIGEAISCGYIGEGDLYGMDEQSLVARFEDCADTTPGDRFSRLFRTFRGMTELVRSDIKLQDHYCVSFDVKRRYVDPLVRGDGGAPARRISEISPEAARLIGDFLAFQDSLWACVRYAP